jgi:hypothetical protein
MQIGGKIDIRQKNHIVNPLYGRNLGVLNRDKLTKEVVRL